MLEVLAALDCPGTDPVALDKTFEVTDEWQAVSQAIYTLKRLDKKASRRPVQDSIGLLNEIERLTR